MEQMTEGVIFMFKGMAMVFGFSISACVFDSYFERNHPGLKGIFSGMFLVFLLAMITAVFKRTG